MVDDEGDAEYFESGGRLEVGYLASSWQRRLLAGGAWPDSEKFWATPISYLVPWQTTLLGVFASFGFGLDLLSWVLCPAEECQKGEDAFSCYLPRECGLCRTSIRAGVGCTGGPAPATVQARTIGGPWTTQRPFSSWSKLWLGPCEKECWSTAWHCFAICEGRT